MLTSSGHFKINLAFVGHAVGLEYNCKFLKSFAEFRTEQLSLFGQQECADSLLVFCVGDYFDI